MSGSVRRETEIGVRVEGEGAEERVAAAESNRVGMAFIYRCMAMLCSFVMVGVIAGCGFFFVRAWVHAFQEVCEVCINLRLHLSHYNRLGQKMLLLNTVLES